VGSDPCRDSSSRSHKKGGGGEESLRGVRNRRKLSNSLVANGLSVSAVGGGGPGGGRTRVERGEGQRKKESAVINMSKKEKKGLPYECNFSILKA